MRPISAQPSASSPGIGTNRHYSAAQREAAKERDEAQKRTNAIKQTLAEFRNNFQNDLQLSGLFKEASERVAYNPNNSYTKACADAIEAVCAVSSELNSKGLAQQASALRNLAEAINFASEVTLRPANVHAAAPSSLKSEPPVKEVQLALQKAFTGLQYASSATKEAFVKAYQDFKAQPTEGKIRDLAMVGVAIMLSEATVSTVLVRAVAQHVAYLITAEVAATGALAVATGIRNNPVAPITTTWQAIAEDASAVRASAPSTVSTMVSSSQSALQTVATTFQPPAVMQPSVMAGHAAALQAAQANAVVSAVGNVADLKTASEMPGPTASVGKEIKPARIEFSKNDIPHIFRNKTGHLLDTPENRKLLLDTANDIENFLGADKYGSQWYAKILPNGNQSWAVVRDGFIRYAGLNETPHIFNTQTGLSRNLNS